MNSKTYEFIFLLKKFNQFKSHNTYLSLDFLKSCTNKNKNIMLHVLSFHLVHLCKSLAMSHVTYVSRRLLDHLLCYFGGRLALIYFNCAKMIYLFKYKHFSTMIIWPVGLGV